MTCYQKNKLNGRIAALLSLLYFTFKKDFLIWEEEASSTACRQHNKLQQPEPDIKSSSNIELS